jgi:hypothetical protein
VTERTLRLSQGQPVLSLCRVAFLIASAAALVALAGCSSGATSTLAQTVSQGVSAAQTARTMLEQQEDGRLTTGVSSTGFADMLTEAEDAESAALGAAPATADERRTRSSVVAALHETTLAITDAQDASQRAPGAPTPRSALGRLSRVLTQLAPLQHRLGSGR